MFEIDLFLAILCFVGMIFAPRTTLAVLLFSTGNVVLGGIAAVCAFVKLIVLLAE